MSELAQKFGVEAGQPVRVGIEPVEGTAGEAVKEWVVAGAQGWLCYASGVVRIGGATDLRDDLGEILSGELASGDRTLAIRFIDDAAEPRHALHELSRSQGSTHLCFEEKYRGIAPGWGDPEGDVEVVYEVYWPAKVSLDDPYSQVGPTAARFVRMNDASPEQSS